MTKFSLSKINDRITKESAFINPLRASISEVIVGQDELINKISEEWIDIEEETNM